MRKALGARRERPSRGDAAYAVYLAVCLVIVVAAPIVRASVLSLAGTLPASAEPQNVALLSGVLLVLTSLLTLAGTHTGPVRASLPEIDLLLTSGLSRVRLLGPRALRSVALAAIVCALPAGLILSARAIRGEFEAPLAAALLCAAAAVGVFGASAMLVGQYARVLRWALAGMLGALGMMRLAGASGASAYTVTDPWSVAALFALMGSGTELAPGTSTGDPSQWLSVAGSGAVLFGLAVLVGGLVALLLPKTRWEPLRRQALNASAIGALVATGDVKSASARVGAPVTVGRHWKWRVPRGSWLAFVSRDLLGIARTPARSIAALLGAFSAVWLFSLGGAFDGLWEAFGGTADAVSVGSALETATQLSADPAALAPLGAVALLVLYAALGPWTRGLRAAADSLGAAHLFPFSNAGLLARHLVVPGVLVTLVSAAAAAAALGASQGAAIAPAQIVIGALFGLLALALRLPGAVKGPLPQKLLAPVPTPAGDLASLIVLCWSLDGPIWALVLGGLFAVVAAVSSGWAILLAAVMIALLLIWTAARLRTASRVL